jgi:hypothetical protein
MIKLQTLLEDVYAEKPETEYTSPGFKLSAPEIDPETGTSTSYVTYDPQLRKIEAELYGYIKAIRKYKQSSNREIADLTTSLSIALSRIAKAMGQLHDKVELEKEKK